MVTVHSFTTVEVPPSWDPMPQDSMITFRLVELNVNFEYQMVANAFTSTMPPPGSTDGIVWNSIIKIERVQNPMLYAQYSARKKAMDNPNEKKLFHGCPSSVVTNICQQGFNRSFAGAHGKLANLYVHISFVIVIFTYSCSLW